MEYTTELQKVLDEKNIKKDEILFLVMEEAFLDEVKSGKVKVEHKKAKPFLLSRLFKKKLGVYSVPKKKTHFLFQSGYKSDGRRMLVELKEWVVGSQKFPQEEELAAGFDDETPLDLFIGEVIYDSLG